MSDAAAPFGVSPQRALCPIGCRLAAALLFSLVLLWFITKSPLVTAGFGGGVLALGAFARSIAQRPAPQQAAEVALPDWSVTVAAIDRADVGIAITDRAGRLVCANRSYEAWFGIAFAPPLLPVDEASLERLARAARAAWRDGMGQADLLDSPMGRWRAEAARSGRGEDFLVWRFFPIVAADLGAQLAEHLDGKLGRALSQAGIAAAIVDPAGMILSASAGFALRATGDPLAAVVGKEFVSFLLPGRGRPLHAGRAKAARARL